VDLQHHVHTTVTTDTYVCMLLLPFGVQATPFRLQRMHRLSSNSSSSSSSHSAHSSSKGCQPCNVLVPCASC